VFLPCEQCHLPSNSASLPYGFTVCLSMCHVPLKAEHGHLHWMCCLPADCSPSNTAIYLANGPLLDDCWPCEKRDLFCILPCAFDCLPSAFACLPSAFACLPSASHCLPSASHCLPVSSPCEALLTTTGGSDLAKRLIDIYFTLFKMILEGHIGRAAAAAKEQEAKLPAKSKDRHRDRQVTLHKTSPAFPSYT